MVLFHRQLSALLFSTFLVTFTFIHAQNIQAQDIVESTQSPEDYARLRVAQMGKSWNASVFAETTRLYTAAQREVVWPALRKPQTVSYGSHPQQTFRLFLPDQEFGEPGPVFIYLHGNNLSNSDQMTDESEDLIYANFGRFAAYSGGIGLTANYRNDESSTILSGAEDLRLVVEWVRKNIASYGGDLDTIVLFANSNGATNAATYLFNEDTQLESGIGLSFAVLSSGVFGSSAPGLTSMIEDYSGERVPLALWVAEYDVEPVESGIARLYDQLCRKYQNCPYFRYIHGHNHVSHVMSFGTRDNSARNAFLRFYHTLR